MHKMSLCHRGWTRHVLHSMVKHVQSTHPAAGHNRGFDSLLRFCEELQGTSGADVPLCRQHVMTYPVFIIYDLDYAAVLVFHRGRGHWLFWLNWLRSFLFELLLGDNGSTKQFTVNQISRYTHKQNEEHHCCLYDI